MIEWIEHLFVPKRNVELAKVMQTLQLKVVLLVFDAFNHDVDIVEFGSVLVLLDILQDVESAISLVVWFKLPDLFFQWVHPI